MYSLKKECWDNS